MGVTMTRLFHIVLLATVINGQLSIDNFLHAQVNYQQQYVNAKNLFHEGKYNLAMESFKSLIAYDKNNPFSEYASFYYGLSAYHQGYKSVAKDMFSQIRQLYPTWDQLDEVNLWVAKIHFDNKEYFQAINQLAAIRSSKLQKEIATIKKNEVAEITDLSTLTRLHQEYPRDPIIGERLAVELSKNIDSREDKELFDKLISTFRLKRADLLEDDHPTIYKEKYTVSVMFPFLVNTLDPSPGRKRNQVVLDLYEGMKLAIDSLAKQGIQISLRAYDTERSPEKIRRILEYDELKSSDLIVGPLFQEENRLIQNFSKLYKINLFNPVSNNFDLVRDNPYGFLFQPAWETMGKFSAEFLSTYLTNKKCLVFLGDTKRDSVMSMSFVNAALTSGLKITGIERFTRDNTAKILQILATPTEFDEFKYPKQFTLPKDSLGCIFVTSEDPLIFSKVISSVTTRGDKITILGSESWLDNTTDYEKLQSLGVIMLASNYSSPNNPTYRAFQNKFARVHGRVSGSGIYSNYAKIGYDFMLFAGYLLKKHGVYFQDAFKDGPMKGFVTQGYDFQYSRENHAIPLVQFRDGELVLINNPLGN